MRLFVQKNGEGVWDVTESASRVGYTNRYITNVAYAVQPIDKTLKDIGFDKSVTTKLRMIGLQVAVTLEKYLGTLGEISVDFGIEPDGKLSIIEVNGKPRKELFLRNEALNNALRTPLQYAIYLANH